MNTGIECLLGPRDIVVVTGDDAGTFLQSQLTQDVTPLEDGDARWTFVLSPTGKIEGFGRVTRVSPLRYEIDTDPGFGAGFAERLKKFCIRVDATIEVVDADAEAAPNNERERARVVAGWPKLGAELVPGKTLPAGTGLLGIAVSFTKGCYPGQELVERMDSRGAEAPQRLCLVNVNTGTVAGEPLVVDDQVVGMVSSVAGDTALAWIKRGVDHGETVAWTSDGDR